MNFNITKALNIFFQISILFLIASLLYSDDFQFNKIKKIFTKSSINILFLLISLKILIFFLFSYVTIIISKNNSFFVKISSIFLQGGIISSSIPALGLIYKYKKFNHELGITLTEYSVSQSLATFLSILSYLVLAIIFGFLKIDKIFYLNINLLYILVIFFLFILIYKFRKKFFYNNKLKKIYHEFSGIKKILLIHYFKFLLIFIGYLIISTLQCYAFYKAILLFQYNLDFLTSSYIYISASVVSILAMINLIGLFELILSYTSSFFTQNYIEIIFVGFSFRLLNLAALFVSTLVMYLFDKKNKKLKFVLSFFKLRE